MPRRSRKRSARRGAEREIQKLREELEAIAQRKTGATPDNPIVVSSPVQVETRTEQMPCPLCEGPLLLDQHVAEVLNGKRLRVAHCRCIDCGVKRDFYFRLESPLQS